VFFVLLSAYVPLVLLGCLYSCRSVYVFRKNNSYGQFIICDAYEPVGECGYICLFMFGADFLLLVFFCFGPAVCDLYKFLACSSLAMIFGFCFLYF
jgi:hypothetical protein